MKQPQYIEGPKAHENFEAAMKAVFKVEKPVKRAVLRCNFGHGIENGIRREAAIRHRKNVVVIHRDLQDSTPSAPVCLNGENQIRLVALENYPRLSIVSFNGARQPSSDESLPNLGDGNRRCALFRADEQVGSDCYSVVVIYLSSSGGSAA